MASTTSNIGQQPSDHVVSNPGNATNVAPDNSNTGKDDPTKDDTIGGGTIDEKKGQEHTRSAMALLFVLGFFAILFLCFAYAIKTRTPLNELKDTLVAIIGSLSGIFGFIVGYYYKTSKESK